MKSFVEKHKKLITGTISCFDRVLFRGHLPISYGEAMEGFMRRKGFLHKDFKRLVLRYSPLLKEHAANMARSLGRPYIHLSGKPIRKEDFVKKILCQDPVDEGLVCILAAVEACQSFKLVYGKGYPRLVNRRRKCLCLYYYFLDRRLGLLHVRIQTWFPFTVQVCLNGHEWLARMLENLHIPFTKIDNGFVRLQNPRRVQRIADRFVKRYWVRILDGFARKVNPLLRSFLKPMRHHWVIDQSEYATDILFKNPSALRPLYQSLLRHALLRFGSYDLMSYLGRKLHGNFIGQIGNDYKNRLHGARVRHRIKDNAIKMYDKHGSILRVETVINSPREFKVRRWGIRRGKPHLGWRPMNKGVSNFYRHAEIGRGANHRYLAALAGVEDPAPAIKIFHSASRPVRYNGRCFSGFNPASEKDSRLFAAVMRGEHNIHGFRNRDIRSRLFPTPQTLHQAKLFSARTSRLLKRLHLHGFIARVPRSRRWRVTNRGTQFMGMALKCHQESYVQHLSGKAA